MSLAAHRILASSPPMRRTAGRFVAEISYESPERGRRHTATLDRFATKTGEGATQSCGSSPQHSRVYCGYRIAS